LQELAFDHMVETTAAGADIMSARLVSAGSQLVRSMTPPGTLQ
jgi:hypothetical protein